MFKSETDSNIIYFAADGMEAVQKAQELQYFNGRQSARYERL